MLVGPVEVMLGQLWEGIEAVISWTELRDAVAAVTDMVPPPDADAEGRDARLGRDRADRDLAGAVPDQHGIRGSC